MDLSLANIQRQLNDAIQKGLRKVGATSGGSAFFGGVRRGESAELQADINSSDRGRQRNAVKRIIANMSLGRDVSQLFPDVVKLGPTPNLEIKKLVYLYVLNTARLQPDKALLAVNTFLMDTQHTSPIVRALAIRTMLCLRTETVLEYMFTPLRKAVSDSDPYVRKTAAIGLLKLFHQSPKDFEAQGFLPLLVTMLSDNAPVVSSNAAAALHEIVANSPAMDLTLQQDLVRRLLQALPDCTEWGQAYILELLSTHAPVEMTDVEMVIDQVVPRLGHNNPAVVLGAVKVIVGLLPRLRDRTAYVGRLNSALLTLARSDPETQYVVCRNIQALLPLVPELLQSSADYFYIRYDDPACVKREKLTLLLMLMQPENASKIVKELAEYASDVDGAFLVHVTTAVARAAIKHESVAPRCVEILVDLAKRRLEMLPAVVVAAKDILRRQPNVVIDLIPPLLELGASTAVSEDEDASVALVWVLGEFCDVLPDGMELLQSFIESFRDLAAAVQAALLTAVVKLFLRNPQQVEPVVTALLEAATQSVTDPDVRDRAFVYFRLLAAGVGVAGMKRIVHSAQRADFDVAQAGTRKAPREEVVASLNTAGVALGLTAKSFLLPYGLRRDSDEEEDEEDFLPPVEQAPPGVAPEGQGAGAAATTGAAAPKAKGLDDLFAPALAGPAPTSGTAPAARPAVGSVDDLFGPTSTAPAPAAPHNPPAGSYMPAAAPARRVDDDIFSVPAAAAAPFGAPSAKPAPAADPWGALAAPVRPTAAAATTAAAPAASASYPLVFTAPTGVTVHAAVIAPAGHSAVTLQLELRGAAAALNGFVGSGATIDVDPNVFGLLAERPNIGAATASGAGFHRWTAINLISSELSFTAGPPVLRCALRPAVGAPIGPFAIAIPPQLFFASGRPLEGPEFARQWNAASVGSERQIDLVGAACAVSDDVLKTRLQRMRASIVASVPRGDTTIIMATVRTHNGVTALLEIRTQGKRSGTCTVRCPRIDDVAGLVQAALPTLALETLPVVVPAAAASGAATAAAPPPPKPSSTTDDIFGFASAPAAPAPAAVPKPQFADPFGF